MIHTNLSECMGILSFTVRNNLHGLNMHMTDSGFGVSRSTFQKTPISSDLFWECSQKFEKLAKAIRGKKNKREFLKRLEQKALTCSTVEQFVNSL